MFFDYAAFGDELSKIAKEKALYSAAVTAHEAGHSNVHAVPGVMHARIAGQLGGEVLAMQRSILWLWLLLSVISQLWRMRALPLLRHSRR
jgi:hypothetical protein